jgi:type IV secretion system protein VirD4
MDAEGERVLYVALGAVVATALVLVWMSGALAGLLFGAGWTPIDLADAIGVALRWPAHAGDPRVAWPPPARGRLPAAAGIYAVLCLLIGVASGIAALAIRALRDFDLPSIWRSRERPPVARWASRRDLAPLRVPAPRPGRLTLGRRGRSLLAAEERASVIVFGPTQTHKTSGLVIPALLEWEGPVLCTSIKSDVLGPTLARRESLGEVWIFDPARVSDTERSRATPLNGVEDWQGALRVAHWLAGAARASAGDLRDGDFWFANAEKLIAPLLLAARRSSGAMATVVAWLDEGPEACEAAVTPILTDAGEMEAARAFTATQNREERQRSSVYTTAETMLAGFADPLVAAETAGADYTPEALLEGANTLYLVGTRTEQERLRTVFAALIQELVALIEARSSALGGPIEPAVLLLLDEVANLAPIPDLDELASTAAGLGVQLVCACQDLAQLQVRLGRRAATAVNNHRAKLVGRGISDLETINYFTQLIGAGEFELRSVSTSNGEHGRRSQTEGDTYRELAPAHVLRQAKEASAVLVPGSLPPTTVTLRPWYRDAMLRELGDLSSGTRLDSDLPPRRPVAGSVRRSAVRPGH